MASRLNNGISGGMQGAQLGSNFGPQGAIIGGIVGATIGLFTPDYEKKAMEAYNSQVVKNAAMDFFDFRRVQNVNNLEYSQALASYQDNRAVTTAQYNANFGASDTIGASAEALSQVIDFQTTQAMAQTTANWEMGVENANVEMNRATNSAINSLRRKRGEQTRMDYAGMVKGGLDLYKKYKQPSTPVAALGPASPSSNSFGSTNTGGKPSIGSMFG